MALPLVLIALPVDSERRGAARGIAREALGDRAEVLVRGDAADDEVLRRAPEVEVLVTYGFPRDLPDELWPRLARLRLLQTTSAGVDNLPWARIPASVTVCSNAGAYGVSIGEHAIALLLAAAKNVVVHTDAIREGRFRQGPMGKSLRGKTLGVVGLGGIGSEAARLAAGLGMRVVGVNRRGASDAPVEWVGTLKDLDRLLRESDAVLLSIPLTRSTAGLIGARELGLMKRDGILVNVARGRLVNERDLYEHLKAHPAFQAALDVWWVYPKGDGYPFTEPFHTLPNVVMTPHVAWAVPEQARRSLEAALANVGRFLDGTPPRNVVDRSEYGAGNGPGAAGGAPRDRLGTETKGRKH